MTTVALYEGVLFVHSYLRWVILGLGITAAWGSLRGRRQKRPWTTRDERIATAFVGALDLQLLLGLMLHLWLSPIATAALKGGVTVLGYSSIFVFFGAIHPLAQLVGIVIVHGARARARRPGTRDPDRHRIFGLAVVAWLVLVLAAIPWPDLPYGRPLFRGFQ